MDASATSHHDPRPALPGRPPKALRYAGAAVLLLAILVWSFILPVVGIIHVVGLIGQSAT